MDKYEMKQGVLLVCLVGIVGSAASFTNAIFPNNGGAVIAASVGAAMAALFIFLVTELLVVNLKNAILDQKAKDNDELLAVVISRAIYKTIAEEKSKEKI